MNLEIIRGDITQLKVDAIVNAANSSLMGGGGVDGAIHRAGGSAILEACKEIIAKIGKCSAGEAVITTAGNLPSQYVIHTVGPIWQGGFRGEPEILAKCYINSLRIALEYHCKSIAFPNISCGVYGYPKHEAAKIAVSTVKAFSEPGIETVLFVCFDEENARYIRQYL